jgi:2-C-methyl-D-erythritol 4-phosphate cytidylyltransferase
MTGSTIGPTDITMVVLAAGVGDRMGRDIPKQFVKLGDADKPDRTPLDLLLAAYEEADEVGSLVVVCSDEYRDQTESIVANYTKTNKIVLGGANRHDSLYRGIKAVGTTITGIHDAARPILDRPALQAGVERLKNGARAIATVVHPYATMLVCSENGPVERALERWAVAHTLAPAFYYTADLLTALKESEKRGLEFRDEPAMMMGMFPDFVIDTVEGHRWSFKLTYPEDFDLLASLRRQMADSEF